MLQLNKKWKKLKAIAISNGFESPKAIMIDATVKQNVEEAQTHRYK